MARVLLGAAARPLPHCEIGSSRWALCVCPACPERRRGRCADPRACSFTSSWEYPPGPLRAPRRRRCHLAGETADCGGCGAPGRVHLRGFRIPAAISGLRTGIRVSVQVRVRCGLAAPCSPLPSWLRFFSSAAARGCSGLRLRGGLLGRCAAPLQRGARAVTAASATVNTTAPL